MTGRSDRARLLSKRHRLESRARILAALRAHFVEAGFLEVETPIRIPAPAPERHIDAVPSDGWYLITSPELQMKRLLGAGFERLFQVTRCFRAGELGDLHEPEFTMVEWYRSGAGCDELMADCEGLIERCARAVDRWPDCERGAERIALRAPWERIEVRDAFERWAGWRPGARPDPDRFTRDLVFRVEPALPADRPVFLTGYPSSEASLARIDPTDPDRAERFELYAGGLELANGFAELTDAAEQRRRFEKDRRERAAAGQDDYPLDELFLGALEEGLNPCAGIALGVDRLVMLLTDAERIEDVVAFGQADLSLPPA